MCKHWHVLCGCCVCSRFAQYLTLNDENTVIKGSPLYMAPEILLKHSYSPLADLWSIGTILYECLFGRAPYSSKSLDELLHKIKTKQKIVISPAAAISPECRDIMVRLLIHEPDQRITFQEFFDHPFLSAKIQQLKQVTNDEVAMHSHLTFFFIFGHFPIFPYERWCWLICCFSHCSFLPQRLAKAIAIVTHAVQCDEKQDYRTAYYAYCEGLQLFVPLIAAETDAEKRLFLQQVATNYMERAEEIKRSYIAALVHSSNANAMSSASSQPSDASSSSADLVKNALKPTSNFSQICMSTKCLPNWFLQIRTWIVLVINNYEFLLLIWAIDSLFTSTPQVQHALEIGRQGELYSYEQNHAAALDRYTSALNVLVPLLPQEPAGTRKDLLQKQVLEWMKEAESSKALVLAHKATDNKTDHQHCSIQ